MTVSALTEKYKTTFDPTTFSRTHQYKPAHLYKPFMQGKLLYPPFNSPLLKSQVVYYSSQMTTPTHPPSLIRRDATDAELAYLTLRRDFLDSLRDQHRVLRNRKEMTEERRSDILETLRNLASQTEDIKMAGLRMKDEQPLCRAVCENRIWIL